MRIFLSLLLFCLLSTLRAEEVKTSDWNGFQKLDFKFEGRDALLVLPKEPAAGHPWIWRTEFFGHEPQGDIALLKAGWAAAYVKVSDMYGAPPAIEIMSRFHDAIVAQYHLSPRVVLEGFSRGGLYAVNYAAAHPDQTAALYLDAPVLDVKSWPGGTGKSKGAPNLWPDVLKNYGLTPETLKDFHGSPIDHAEQLAKAHIPIISVCGGADTVVPFDENTGPFQQRYEKAGGTIKVIVKPGGDHHPHSLPDPTPIVDFLLKEAKFTS